MFVSLPEYRFHVPTPIASPGASYWRSLVLSTNTPWYVLTVQPSEEGPADTFLLAWDSDLIEAINASNVQVQSLLLLARAGVGHSWTPIEIAEIWEASDPEDDATVALLVDTRGHEYSGFFMHPAVNVQRVRLVARISDHGANLSRESEASHESHSDGICPTRSN